MTPVILEKVEPLTPHLLQKKQKKTDIKCIKFKI